MQTFIDSLHDAFRADDPVIDAKTFETERFRHLQAMYQSLLQGDIDRFIAELAEEVELEILGPASVPFLGKWKGKSDVVKTILRNFSMIEPPQPVVQSVTAQGNQIVVIGQEKGRYRSGTEYDLHWIQIFTYRDGKIASIRELLSGAA